MLELFEILEFYFENRMKQMRRVPPFISIYRVDNLIDTLMDFLRRDMTILT